MEHTRAGGWYWLFASVLLVSFAQLVFKYGMTQLPGEPALETYLQLIDPRYLFTVLVPIFSGLAAYTASVFCWLATLARLPLSVAYPSLALSYLLVYVGGTLLPIFQEESSALRLVGVLLVAIGVWLVGRTPEDPVPVVRSPGDGEA